MLKFIISYLLLINFISNAQVNPLLKYYDDEINHLYGFVDTSFNLVVEAKYRITSEFDYNIAFVAEDYDDNGWNWIIIDTLGNKISDYDKSDSLQNKLFDDCYLGRKKSVNHTKYNFYKEEFSSINDFHDNYSIVKTKDQVVSNLDGENIIKKGGYGIIDTNGKYLIPPVFHSLEYPSEGMILAIINNKRGFIDTSGRVIVDFIYDDAYNFSEGLAAVKVNELWGFINKDGMMIIQPQFHSVNDFSDSIAPVSMDYGWRGLYEAYINKLGKIIFEGDYWYPQKFKYGYSKSWNGYHFSGGIKYIDKEGNIMKAKPKKKS